MYMDLYVYIYLYIVVLLQLLLESGGDDGELGGVVVQPEASD